MDGRTESSIVLTKSKLPIAFTVFVVLADPAYPDPPGTVMGSRSYMWEMVRVGKRRYIRRFSNVGCAKERGLGGRGRVEDRREMGFRLKRWGPPIVCNLGRIAAFSVRGDLCSAIGAAWRGRLTARTTFNYMLGRHKNRKFPPWLNGQFGLRCVKYIWVWPGNNCYRSGVWNDASSL